MDIGILAAIEKAVARLAIYVLACGSMHTTLGGFPMTLDRWKSPFPPIIFSFFVEFIELCVDLSLARVGRSTIDLHKV